jgi:hypothetical protein
MEPQSLNAYSYARNNPLRYTDPTGLLSTDNFVYQLNPLTVTLFAMAGGSLTSLFSRIDTGRSATYQLMGQSWTINPAPQQIFTTANSPAIINQIKSSSDYRSYVNSTVIGLAKDAESEGKTTFDVTCKGGKGPGDCGSIDFKSGDLFTAVGGTLSTRIIGDQKKALLNFEWVM